VVAARLDAWRERAARQRVRVETDVPDGLLVRARAVHVEQVLDNYVDNAISVTPANQRVRITGRRVEDDQVELHVVDDGPGMTEAQIETAFQRFHSGADRPAGRDSGGFGLGLAIVRRLAEVDGATAELRHASGHGIDAVVRYRAAAS
jgi:signal transduction histidine kinase